MRYKPCYITKIISNPQKNMEEAKDSNQRPPNHKSRCHPTWPMVQADTDMQRAIIETFYLTILSFIDPMSFKNP